jgi:hypothetical protein
MIDEKTIAQQLNIKKFPLEIRDVDGNIIYTEKADGYWIKREFDSRRNKTYFITSSGKWVRREFDKYNEIVFEEDSKGNIVDEREKTQFEFTLDEIAKRLNIETSQLRIKK